MKKLFMLILFINLWGIYETSAFALVAKCAKCNDTCQINFQGLKPDELDIYECDLCNEDC